MPRFTLPKAPQPSILPILYHSALVSGSFPSSSIFILISFIIASLLAVCQSMRLLDACPEFLILSFERKGGIKGFMKTDSVGICSSVPSKRSMSESQLFCLASY